MNCLPFQELFDDMPEDRRRAVAQYVVKVGESACFPFEKLADKAKRIAAYWS